MSRGTKPVLKGDLSSRVGESADREWVEVVHALKWSIDRIIDLLPDEDAKESFQLPFGLPAGADPNEYRVWLAEQTASPGLSRIAQSDGPLISVVVPVYKPEVWYFRACVASVQAQTYGNWELCLCDDGSKDGGLSAALEELTASDSRIKVVVSDRNEGISSATNRALGLATGEFVALVDHDDAIEPDALDEIARAIEVDPTVDVIYSDDDKLDEQGHRYDPYFKPDWSPELLLSYPYLGHLLVVRRALLESIGGFRPEFDGSQDFDVMLRATERARRVMHVPKVLYHWRAVSGSAAGDATAKPWAHRASKRVVEDTVRRRKIDGVVESTPYQGMYRVRRRISKSPSVSIIIPFRDQAALTVRCISSLGLSPGYDKYEFVFVDNGSVEPETQALKDRLGERGVKVLDYPGEFNWSVINNLGASNTDSDILLFMNNDIEAVADGWLHALVELAQVPEIGAVGARLLFPDGTLQHAGVVLGLAGIAGHAFYGLPPGWMSYSLWDRLVRPWSAVTGACMMTRREVYDRVGGFDERLQVEYNDTDYCMRVVDAGYQVVYTPHAQFIHHESLSRGVPAYLGDRQYFLKKWGRERIRSDPFYNPNLSLFSSCCALRPPTEVDRWETLIDDFVRARRSGDVPDKRAAT